MKRAIIAVAILMISILMIGCAQQEYVEPKPPINEEPVVEEPVVEEPVVETQPEPIEEPKEVDYLESLPVTDQKKIKAIRKIIDSARESEENYFFRYSGPDTLQNDVWVKGDIVKRAIHRLDDMDKYTTYNMVYMNKKTLKAEGYCETSKSKCFEGHGPFPENYGDNKVMTPKDWLMKYDNNFYWALDNKVHDQLYHIIDYKENGKTIRMWISAYKGWPAKVEIHNGEVKDDMDSGKFAEEEYIYNDFDIGGVSDDDVLPG